MSKNKRVGNMRVVSGPWRIRTNAALITIFTRHAFVLSHSPLRAGPLTNEKCWLKFFGTFALSLRARAHRHQQRHRRAHHPLPSRSPLAQPADDYTSANFPAHLIPRSRCLFRGSPFFPFAIAALMSEPSSRTAAIRPAFSPPEETLGMTCRCGLAQSLSEVRATLILSGYLLTVSTVAQEPKESTAGIAVGAVIAWRDCLRPSPRLDDPARSLGPQRLSRPLEHFCLLCSRLLVPSWPFALR